MTTEYDAGAKITRTFGLDAGHRLSEHDFKCQNFHGHRYEYQITITGDPHPDTGYVVDFSNVKKPVMDAFDHTFILNQDDPLLEGDTIWTIEDAQEKSFYLMPGEPTVENIAAESIHIIWNSLTPMEREAILDLTITLSETPNCKTTRAMSSDPGSTSYTLVHPL